MEPIGNIVQFLKDALSLDSGDIEAKIWRAIRTVHYRIIRLTDWQDCRRTVEITTTAAAGYMLPANLVNIVAVTDSDGIPLDRGNDNPMSVRSTRNAWRYDSAETTPLFSGKGLNIEQGASTFQLSAPAAWAAAWIGEYLTIGAEPGAYLISSSGVLERKYNGPRLVNQMFQVRPPTCRALSVTDYTGARIAATVKATYWQYPDPLYQDWQTVPSYLNEPLKWGTLVEAKGLTVDQAMVMQWKQEYELSLGTAKAQNPRELMQAMPRDRYGSVITMGRR